MKTTEEDDLIERLPGDLQLRGLEFPTIGDSPTMKTKLEDTLRLALYIVEHRHALVDGLDLNPANRTEDGDLVIHAVLVEVLRGEVSFRFENEAQMESWVRRRFESKCPKVSREDAARVIGYIESHRKTLRNFLIRIGPTQPSDADDAIHDLLIRLFSRSVKFTYMNKNEKSLERWTREVLLRSCWRIMRKGTGGGKRQPILADEHVQYDEFDPVKSEQASAIRHCCNELQFPSKEVLVLHCIHGIEYSCLIDAFDMTVSQIKTVISNAAKAVRKCLTRKGFSHE